MIIDYNKIKKTSGEYINEKNIRNKRRTCKRNNVFWKRRTVWLRLNIDIESKILSLLHRALKKYNEEENFDIHQYILKSITKMQKKYNINQTDKLKEYCLNINPENIIENNKGRGKDKKEKRKKYLSKEEKEEIEYEKEKNKSYRFYP